MRKGLAHFRLWQFLADSHHKGLAFLWGIYILDVHIPVESEIGVRSKLIHASRGFYKRGALHPSLSLKL